MYQEIGSPDEAIIELSKVLALEPANPTAHLYLGLAYRDKEFYQEAQNHLERSLELGGDVSAIYAGLAGIFLLRRRFDEALEFARKSTQARDDYVQGHLTTGDIYQAMGEDEIALLKYEKVLSLDPENRDAHFCSAVSYRNLERFDDAVYELRRTLEIDPDCIPAHLELGELYERQNQSARALAEFESVIGLSQDNPELCRKIGRAYRVSGNVSIAAKYFEHLLELRPEDPNAKELLAAAYRDMGRLEESLSLYTDVVNAHSDRATAYQGLAGTYAAMGDSDKEVFFLRKAIKTDPRCAEALHSLGQSYLSRGCTEEAAFVFRKCIRVMPEDPRGYELLGRLEHRQGHLDTAIYQYQKATSLGSRSAELHYDLGRAYLQKGRGLIFKNSLYVDMARRSFLEALQLDTGLRSAPDELRAYLYRIAEEERLLPAGRFITGVTQRFGIFTKRFSLFTDSVTVITSFLSFRSRRRFPLVALSPDFSVSTRRVSPVSLVGLAALVLLLAGSVLGAVPQSPAFAAAALAVAALAAVGMLTGQRRWMFHDRYSHKVLFEYRPDSPGKDEAKAFVDRLLRRLSRQTRTLA
jgi:tetratricopeptide (TPR) repeat protein